MKCYELQGPGGIEALALVDKPVPAPGQGEVLVRLSAASINYRDLLTVKGGYGARQKFPLVPAWSRRSATAWWGSRPASA